MVAASDTSANLGLAHVALGCCMAVLRGMFGRALRLYPLWSVLFTLYAMPNKMAMSGSSAYNRMQHSAVEFHTSEGQ